MQATWISAREASAELNVSRATLYAYVSRGMIRTRAQSGSRLKLYAADDIRRLRARKTAGESDVESAPPLAWGAPVLESAVTLIEDGRLYYRGRDAVSLSDAASLETVAGLLWQMEDGNLFKYKKASKSGRTGLHGAISRLNKSARSDEKAWNVSPGGVSRTGAIILDQLASSWGDGGKGRTVHERLAKAWNTPAAEDLVRRAMVLCADHELNASTFVVRCVAGTGASPYAAVMAGLNALSGPRHGGMSARAAALFDEIGSPHRAKATVLDRLRRGEDLPGFGHPLYPDGDIRAKALLSALERAAPDSAEAELTFSISSQVADLRSLQPNLDFALVSIARAFQLPAFAPFALFATGRCVGWIAHAIEQYETAQLIRPRARYTGEVPQIPHNNRLEPGDKK